MLPKEVIIGSNYKTPMAPYPKAKLVSKWGNGQLIETLLKTGYTETISR